MPLFNTRTLNTKSGLKNYRIHSIVWCTIYFDILNYLGVDQQCDRQRDGHTRRQNDDSNSVRLTTCISKTRHHNHHQNALLKDQLTYRSRKHLVKIKVIVLNLVDIGKR